MNKKNILHFGYNYIDIKIYFINFIISIILTIIPFFVVIQDIVDKNIILWIIIGLAITQILIHFIYFLNINIYSENYWDFISLIFTILIINIIIIGSLWIMYNLQINMMIN